jgi:hypothetical protein
MSQLLRAFYITYYEWLQQGAKEKSPYSRGCGLCANITLFCVFMELSGDCENELHDELTKQFYLAGLSGIYPFNTSVSYLNECLNNNSHENPERVAWVNEQVGA